jgi:hypothetical protein
MRIREPRAMTRTEALAIALGLALSGVAAALFVNDDRIAADRAGGFTVIDRGGRVIERLVPQGDGDFWRQGVDGRPLGTLEDRPLDNGFVLRDALGREEGEVRPHPFGAAFELRDRHGRVVGLIEPGSAPGQLRLLLN